MRPEASLVLAGTLFAAGMLFMVSGSGHTLEWEEMGVGGGAIGALLSLHGYVRLLAGRANLAARGAAIPLFWKGIALLMLFAFWFSAALAVNTAGIGSAPLDRIDGIVSGKRVSKGRHSDSYYAQIATSRGEIEAGMPKDVWSGVAVGQRFKVLLCPGLLGYPYIVTPLDRGPYLDIKGILGLREYGADLRC